MASGLSGLRKVPCRCSGDVETQPGEDSITQQGVPRVGSHSPRGHEGKRTGRWSYVGNPHLSGMRRVSEQELVAESEQGGDGFPSTRWGRQVSVRREYTAARGQGP